MDQLTAYKVLGLEPNSTTEEVKEAYAALSKQFHPEESPEQFQKVHEAYVTLTRRRGRRNAQNVEYEKPSVYQDEEETQSELNFKGLQRKQEISPEANEPEEEETKESYSFEDALEKAKQEEEAKVHELVLEATAELKLLVSPKYKDDVKAFKNFFRDKKYEPIIKNADFLERLCDILETSKLKKAYYVYIIDFYRLRGYQPSELNGPALRLYRMLDERAGMKKPINPGIYGGVIAGILAGLRAARPALRGSHAFSIIILLAFLGILGFLVYRKWKEKHSPLLVQAVIAIVLIVSQFAVVMTDFYGTLFGTVDDGNLVATLIMLAALVWLAVIVVVVVIKAIIRMIRK